MKRNVTTMQHSVRRKLMLLCMLCLFVPILAQAQGQINANFSSNVTSGCAPLTVSFTDLSPGTVTTWAWDFDNNGTVESTVANPTHVYTTPGTYTVRLFVTDIPGTNTGTIVITGYMTVWAPPTANAGPNRVFCLGSGVTIGGSPTATGGAGPYTYSWSPSTGLSSTTVANPVATPSVTTTYTVTVTDSRGCMNTSSTTVSLGVKPTASAGPGGSVCYGTGIQIGGAPTASGGTSPYTYTWSPAAGLSSTTVPTPMATPTTTTTYRVIVMDANGCRDTSTTIVTVYPRIIVNAGGTKGICDASGVVIGGTPTASGGTPPFIFSWSPSTALSSTTVANPLATPVGATTYTVTVTDSRGCIAVDSVLVVPATPPTANAGPAAITCFGTGVPIGGSPTASNGSAPYSYTWSPALGLSSTTAANPTANPTATTTYTVIVMDANSCRDTAQVVVTVRPSATVNAGVDQILCAGSPPAPLGGSPTATGGSPPYTYSWSPAAGLSSTTLANPTANPTSTTNYVVAVTDAQGCVVRDTVRITAGPRPVADPGANASSCTGAGVIIGGSPAATGGTGPYTYSWTPSTGLNSALVANPFANPSITTTYTLVVTDANGCQSVPAMVTVTTNPNPAPVLSASGPTTLCQGDSVQLSAPTGFVSYTWSNGATTRQIWVKQAGSYYTTVTNGGGCQGISDTLSVTVNPKPAPVLSTSGPANFCQGDSVAISAPPGFVSYLWSNGATTQGIVAKQSGNYSCQVTNSSGCWGRSDTVRVVVTALPVPVITAVGAITFCDGDSVRLTVVNSFTSYLWSSGDTTRTITVKLPGTYSVLVTNAGGCSATSNAISTVVNPKPLPLIFAQGPTTFCQGDSTLISAPAGFLAYLWSNGATTPAIYAKQSGNYSVLVTNATGCKGRSDTIAVTVNPLPNPTVVSSGPSSICTGDSVTLSVSSNYIGYLWSTGESTSSISASNAGKYWVLVTNANGCEGFSDTITISTFPLPTPRLTITGPTTFCQGGSVRLMAPFGYPRYRWSNGDTTRYISARTSGAYWVVVTNSNGCQGSSDTVMVTVNPLPTPTVLVNGLTQFCSGDSVELIAPSGYNAYLWSNGKTTQSIYAKVTGNYSVLVTNSDGCQGRSDTVPVTSYARPKPIITAGSTDFCQGGSVSLAVQSGFAAYFWSNGDTTRTTTVNTPGSYWMVAFSTNGCEGYSDTVTVSVHSAPTATITASGPTRFCMGDSVRLSVPAGFRSYRWSTGSTDSSIYVKQSGSYWVMLTNGYGCTASSDTMPIQVNVLPVPVLVTSGPTGFCAGGSVQLDAPAGFRSYLWSTGDTTQSITVTTTGSYWALLTNSSGCQGISDTVKTSVYAVPKPAITASSSFNLCFGDSVRLSAPAGYLTYNWSSGDTTRTIMVNVAGAYSVAVIDTNGCFGISDTANVTVYEPVEKPTLTISRPVSFCEGDSTELMVKEVYAHYKWSTGDTTQTIVVTTSGVYSVMVGSADGCFVASDSVLIDVKPAPTPTIQALGETRICQGDSVVLRAPDGYTSYLWSTGDTTPVVVVRKIGDYYVMVSDGNGCFGKSNEIAVTVNVPPVPTITSLGEPSVCQGGYVVLEGPKGFAAYSWNDGSTDRVIIARESGSYIVSVVDSAGCSGTSEPFEVIVHPTPVPEITFSGSPMLCEGDSLRLTATEGFVTYRWSTGDTGRQITVSSTGLYRVDVIDSNGCSGSSALLNVKVNVRPDATITGPATICRVTDGVYSVMSDTAYNYNWNVSGIPNAITNGQGTNQITVMWADSGHAVLSVSVVNMQTGCIATQSMSVTVGQPFVAEIISGGSSLCSGDTMTLDAGAGYAKYLWSTGDTTQMIRVADKGTYTVMVENFGGCSASASTSIDQMFITPKVNFSIIGRVRYVGDTASLTVTPDNFVQYNWYKDGVWLNSNTTNSLTVRENGNYRVEVTDSNGCHTAAELLLDMWKRATTIVSLPRMEASPGDSITVPLQVIFNNLDANEARPYHAVIRFNKSLLMPIGTTPRGRIEGNDRILEIDGFESASITDSGSSLFDMRFVAMLGDAESAAIQIESFAWADSNIVVERAEDGTFYVNNLCREGGTRLFVSDANALVLKQNVPNPANGITSIEYGVRDKGSVVMELIDVAGNQVSTLVDDQLEPGQYLATFDVSHLASGVYLVRLRTPSGVLTRKIVVTN